MEAEELTKLVDGIYKNILDKFNPGARQMINAGKAYLKALHGAATASGLYVETITKLAKQAQQGAWGGSSDIELRLGCLLPKKGDQPLEQPGASLMQVVEVYKEIQAQQMNILKAFYVDLLVPLETNLEKDTKVVQLEQKKFLQQHKARTETFTKAAANIKKNRKKGIKGGTKTGSAVDKELKNMQILEEEKSKLDVFCEESLKNAMTQERRRYGFVLERQCSLAKHYLAYHNAGATSYGRLLEEWQEVARTREFLPKNLENMFALKLRQLSFWQDSDNVSQTAMDEDRLSISSQLRKTKSMDASCLDVRSINDVSSLKSLSRAKSEFNLHSSNHSLEQEESSCPSRPKSMALTEKSIWGETSLARAMYAYLSSGDNQLSFLEGDIIILLGDRKKGWQFGRNLRTQCSGWFPLAYTEVLTEEKNISSPFSRKADIPGMKRTETQKTNNSIGTSTGKPPSMTMFGDTLLHRKLKKQNAQKTPVVTSLGPPPPLPAPIPEMHQHMSPSLTTSALIHSPQAVPSPRSDASTLQSKRPNGYPPPMPPLPLHLGNNHASGAPGSLHSSNDSGFSNDPPPQPEIDYSDDDSSRVQKTTPIENTSSATIDAKKRELFSSVRGWLLYKSALDLWDDVSEQNGAKHSVARTLSARQTDNSGGTLGRFSSHDLLKPSPIAVGRTHEESNNKVTVKRTKSLWKFKRSNKNDILEGMALWKHRSLIDVRMIDKEENQEEKVAGEKSDSIYASADSLVKERQPRFEKVNNDKNSAQNEKNDQENYCKSDTTGLDDSSESIIVVNDHINMAKKRSKCRYNVSNHSDITQSDTIVEKENKSEMSNSRSDLSEQTETETIGKESYLPRMKLIKSISNDTWNHYIEKDLCASKEYQTWNPNLKNKEVKKWREEKRKNANVHKERPNNKLKDAPKLFKDQLRLTDINATYGPWHDLWGVDAPVKTVNVFAAVKLRKTKTNDRSAPFLS